MNILLINPILYTPPFSGGEVNRISTLDNTMAVNYALGFVQLGHSVTIVASEEYKPLNEKIYEGIDIVYFPNIAKRYIKRFPNGFPILKGLKRWLKRENNRFDIIISSEAFTYTTYIAASVCPKKTIIWQELGSHNRMLRQLPSKIWYNTIVRCLMKRVLVVPRSEIARRFISQYSSNVSTTIVSHGLNTDTFYSSVNKQNYFAIISRLIESKNIVTTINKFNEFIKSYASGSNWLLIIAGEGPERPVIEQEIEAQNLQDRVILRGRCEKNEVGDILRGATAMLTDSLQEYNMISMSEALACGTPVITNRVPYTSYEVEKYDLGIVKDDWDWHDMVKVIECRDEYVRRCTEYSSQLSYTYLAQKMLDAAQALR
ncbi:MAG: glycosyltransferase [Alistipes sp.]|nr:glycosyltransferase [Alistipes sp.]